MVIRVHRVSRETPAPATTDNRRGDKLEQPTRLLVLVLAASCSSTQTQPPTSIANARLYAQAGGGLIQPTKLENVLTKGEKALNRGDVFLKTGSLVAMEVAPVPQVTAKKEPGAPWSPISNKQRQWLFLQTEIVVCTPVALAHQLNGFTQMLTLFDEAETEVVGKWMSYLQGGLGVAGAVVEVIGLATSDKSSQYVGLAGIGASAIFAFLKAIYPNGAKIIQKTLIRAEFNRQFGIAFRQYKASVDEGTKVCDALDVYVDPIATAPTDVAVPAEKVADLRKALGYRDVVFDGVLKLGSVAKDIYQDLQSKFGTEDKLAKDLAQIADASPRIEGLRKRSNAVLANYFDCLDSCPVAAAP